MHTKLIMENLKTKTIISELKDEAQEALKHPLFEYFMEEPRRVETMSISAPHIYADFSKNILSSRTFQKLCQIHITLQIDEKIKKMFEGEDVNTMRFDPPYILF